MRTGQIMLANPIQRSRFPYRWHYVNDTRMKFQFSLPEQVQEREKLPNHAAIIKEVTLPNTTGYNAGKRLYNRLRGRINWDGVTDDLYDVLTDLDGTYSQWNRRHTEHQISLLTVDTYMDQSPHPDSRVLLSQEKDALGIPQAKIDWTCYRLGLFRTRTRRGTAIQRNIGILIWRCRCRTDEDSRRYSGPRTL
jgi:hypothetical protein